MDANDSSGSSPSFSGKSSSPPSSDSEFPPGLPLPKRNGSGPVLVSSPQKAPKTVQSHSFTAVSANSHVSSGVYQHALKAVVSALLFNVLIALSKLAVALTITRSAALFAEALHSAADAFNSCTLLFGILQGKRTPDRTHPYGYGLETNFWALMASFVLFISSGVAIWMGFNRLNQPAHIENPWAAMAILLLSVVFELAALNVASTAVLEEVGKSDTPFWWKIPQSLGLLGKVISPTTRFVFLEDLIALAGALIALMVLALTEVAVAFGWLPHAFQHWPDAIASMLIGGLLLLLAINLFGYNRNFLTGAAASATVESQIEDLVLSTHGISSILELKTIDQGASGLLIHLKVEVDPDIPIRDMDDMIEHLKTRLTQNIPNLRDVIVEVVADESELAWEEQFEELVEEGLKQEVINPREAAILGNFHRFCESVLSDVMIPRTDVVSVELNTPLAEVADCHVSSRHSKLPVYKERVDAVVGVVHARDVFDCLQQNAAQTPLEALVKPLDIYPETKPLSDLLEDFKRKRIQMGAVLDEHGSFVGLVTIADLMEELVGDLWEEPDEPEELEWSQLSPNSLLLSGKVDIADLNERYGLNIPEEDFKTVGGFVFGLLGRQPEEGDEVSFEDLTFVVVELDGSRIQTVTLHSKPLLVDTEANETEPPMLSEDIVAEEN